MSHTARTVDTLLIRTAAGQAGIGNNDGHISPPVRRPSPAEQIRKWVTPSSPTPTLADHQGPAQPYSQSTKPRSRMRFGSIDGARYCASGNVWSANDLSILELAVADANQRIYRRRATVVAAPNGSTEHQVDHPFERCSSCRNGG